ncbi:MAG: hypothetical protein JRI56_00240 [Deltaproteobacteria bacterium]|nr:hypothetical protein [Deltaproteobacteria bacterium]
MRKKRDEEYESWINEELLSLGLLFCKNIRRKKLPDRLIVGAERRGDSIRECISDNLDFLRLAIKYVLFEVDALEREKETK